MARKVPILDSPAVLGSGQITRGGLPHDYPAPTFTGRVPDRQSPRPVYSPETREDGPGRAREAVLGVYAARRV